MKKIISAINNYFDNKKTEKFAEDKAWRDVHEAKVKADAMGEAGAFKVGEGWDELEASCSIQDKHLSDIMADAATAKIAEGMDELQSSHDAANAAESAAMDLAKGDVRARNMHKYMLKPTSSKSGPYI